VYVARGFDKKNECPNGAIHQIDMFAGELCPSVEQQKYINNIVPHTIAPRHRNNDLIMICN